MRRFTSSEGVKNLTNTKDLRLPEFNESLQSVLSSGESFPVSGTNVIRVPFGVRQPIKQRPQRPERLATLVIPIQTLGSPTPPPQAA